MSIPGWKTMVSTKDVRTREQREQDRKARQLEKLPKPEALHDFQYPMEKTVLADHMFQPPVYENELDTPALFDGYAPTDFFVNWNAHSFEHSEYPHVPSADHRLLLPMSDQWAKHCTIARKYLTKHQVVPQFLPHVEHSVNLSVVFPSQNLEKGVVPPKTRNPPPTVESLTAHNFWCTAHFGNFIPLNRLTHQPSLFLRVAPNDRNRYFTLIVASPDYPYRAKPHRGFFLNTIITNIAAPQSEAEECRPVVGSTIADYVHPLPTEDAGTCRTLCLLFRQEAAVAPSSTVPVSMPFALRSNFRLHEDHRDHPSLSAVEAVLPADPCAATFFQTSWDIQVQEYYEEIRQPEPRYTPEDVLQLLRLNSLPPERFQVQSRKLADGSRNDGEVKFQLEPFDPTMNSRLLGFSRRTLWPRDGRPKAQIL